MGFIQKPQSVWLRRVLFQVHLWVGIATGLYVFVVCVTGAALIFRIDMQRAAFPELFTPSGVAPPAHPAVILDSLKQAFPDDRVSGIDAPSTTRPTYLAYVMRGNRFLTLLLDPVTGRVLGELPERSIVRTVQDLHFDLFAGRTGRIVNGVGAVCLLLMAITGIVIWWPGIGSWTRALSVDFRRSWRRINFDLHSAIGIWTAALVAMWAITGVYFVWPQAFRTAVNAVSPITVTRPPVSTRQDAPPVEWRRLIDTAYATVGAGQHVARVVVPSSDTAAFLVMFSDVAPTPAGSPRLTSVYLDQYSGEVLQQAPVAGRSAGDVIMAWVAPLHVGNFGGNGIRAAWLILGLSPPLLFVTGFFMWWSRVVRPRWLRAGAKTAAAAALAIVAFASPAAAQYAWTLAPRVAAPRVPVNAPITPARVELGRHLFYDTRLSGNGTQSCATCHLQEKAFTNGRKVGLGSTGESHSRSPMTLINVAYRDTLTWAHPDLRSLDEQVLVPLLGTSPVELGIGGHEARIYAALGRDPVYQRLFAAAFAGEDPGITTPRVAAALAAFLRSIVSFRSPFDRYRQHEDQTALSPAAERGMTLFFSNRKARCISCHRGLNLDGGSKTVDSPPNEEAIFTFHNTGLYNLPGPTSYPADNTGLHAHTGKAEDMGRFRVPTLRNIAVTAPYMHDGSIATLDEVLDHYVKGGRTANPAKSTGLQPLTLTADERRDLIAFLESLTDREALADPRWSDPWK